MVTKFKTTRAVESSKRESKLNYVSRDHRYEWSMGFDSKEDVYKMESVNETIRRWVRFSPIAVLKQT